MTGSDRARGQAVRQTTPRAARDRRCTRKGYGKRVPIAAPRFFDNLRAALTAPTAALVATTIDKDLGSIEARDLPRHARDVLRV
jgi:hypothetical protein